MIDPERSSVVWLGSVPPPAIANEFKQRDLALQTQDPIASSAVTACLRPGVRAVLLSVEGIDPAHSFAEALGRLRRPVLNSGALLAAVAPDAERHSIATQTIAALYPSGSGKIQTLDGQAPHKLAQTCLRHAPGRALKKNPGVDPKGDPVDAVLEILLRRAFNDFESIYISSLEKGLSTAAGVWRVAATRSSGGVAAPFVVKAGPSKDIDTEIETQRNHVLDFVPFPNRPPVLEDRCVSGETMRLLVTMFVDRATRLDEYLKTHSAKDAIAGLFQGPLRTWRQNARNDEVALGRVFGAHGVLPRNLNVEKLGAAYERAFSESHPVTKPAELVARIESYPMGGYNVCRSHGALHEKNIFVRDDTGDVVLIDFGSARYESPMSRDPAKLEVSLALSAFLKGSAPRALLETLYEPPLLPPRRIRDCFWREHRLAEAVRHIRSHAASEGSLAREYSDAVACTLLGFARFGAQGAVPAHGLAYRLADRIVQGLAIGAGDGSDGT